MNTPSQATLGSADFPYSGLAPMSRARVDSGKSSPGIVLTEDRANRGSFDDCVVHRPIASRPREQSRSS